MQDLSHRSSLATGPQKGAVGIPLYLAHATPTSVSTQNNMAVVNQMQISYAIKYLVQ